MEPLVLIPRSELDEIKELIVSRSKAEPLRECLTRALLAEEWGCSEQAIKNWTERPENPLPVHYIGADPRYYRSEFMKWSREEADRKLKRKLKLVA